MWTKMAPSYANLLLARFEANALTHAPHKPHILCFKVAQTKMQYNLEFSLFMILMMIIIVMLFLGRPFNNFNIPRLYFKVAHPKVQGNPV